MDKRSIFTYHYRTKLRQLDGASRRPTIEHLSARANCNWNFFCRFTSAGEAGACCAVCAISPFCTLQATNTMNKIIIVILMRARGDYGNGGLNDSCCYRCLVPGSIDCAARQRWLAKFPDKMVKLFSIDVRHRLLRIQIQFPLFCCYCVLFTARFVLLFDSWIWMRNIFGLFGIGIRIRWYFNFREFRFYHFTGSKVLEFKYFVRSDSPFLFPFIFSLLGTYKFFPQFVFTFEFLIYWF